MPINVADIEWLGLELTRDALAGVLQIRQDQVNPEGRLYGGVAVAAALVLMEESTGRRPAWITVQFAGTGAVGEFVELRTTVSAAGGRTSQLRVVGAIGTQELFVAVGAVRHVDPPGEIPVDPDDPFVRGQWVAMPDVEPPDACPVLELLPPGPDPEQVDHLSRMELRSALGFDRPPADRIALWCRPAGAISLSPAVLGWQADLVWTVLAKATGALGGTSLDNTLRFARDADPVDAWVLADLRAIAMVNGYGHGSVALWSPGGDLLAIGSQTCKLRRA